MSPKVLFSSLLAIGILSCQKPADLQVSSATVVSKATPANNNMDRHDRSVLFISDRDGGDYDVFAMNPDGSNLVQLTSNTVADGRATWSANGQLIAFLMGASGNRDIYVMNANGQGLRNVTNTTADEDWVEWSPNGNKLLFSSNRDGATNYELYTMDLDGNEVTRLTNRPTTYDGWGSYSPDGTMITWHSNVGGSSGTEVFVMNADGSNITRLTTSAGLDQMPTWSPDGSKIAFMSTRDGNPNVYVMNADGTNQTALTSNLAADARPSWSRESNMIFFSSTRVASKWNIYKMNPDGTGQVALTNETTNNNDFPFAR